MKVIELCGKAGVGKDTFCNELIKQLESSGYKCLHIAFADYLKFICKQYFNWDGKKDEKGREMLQRVGTDMFRKKDPNFWVDIVIKFLIMCEEYKLFDYAIITDARFPNEIGRIYQELEAKAGIISKPYRIIRNNFISKLSEEAQKHDSEIALDNFEMDEIVLSGNLEELSQEVKEFIEKCL